MTGHELAARQQDVLTALLRGEVPHGFDEGSALLTIRVLQTKRRSEAVAAVPSVKTIDGFTERFDTWATAHPRQGCAHDDVLHFLVGAPGTLPEPFASIRSVERVYRRSARWGRDRRDGVRPWVVATGSRVWHLGSISPRRVLRRRLR